jgi:heptosyltransferase-2
MHIVVVQTAFLGDLVLTTPLLRELRRARPGARISVVTTPLGREVFGTLPYVDEVQLHRKRPSLPSLVSGWLLGRRLRANGVDVAIAAHRSHRSGMVVRMSGAARRVGFHDAAGAWAYTQRVERDLRRHAVDRYLGLSVAVGGDPQRAPRQPELRFPASASRQVARTLAGAGISEDAPLLCLAPGSVWATKRWPPDGYAALATAARARGLQPLLVGSTAEAALCRRVADHCAERVPVVAGRTGISELAALFSRSRALVSNDSGAAHVAAAVGTPVVTIFGATVPALGYTAVGESTRIVEHESLDCRPCHRHGARRCPRGHFRCMREISPGRVLVSLDELLRTTERQVTALRRPG